MSEPRQEKVLNLDELLFDVNKDLPSVLALIIAVCRDAGVDVYFQSDSKQIEVIATKGEGEFKEEFIAYAEREENSMLRGE